MDNLRGTPMPEGLKDDAEILLARLHEDMLFKDFVFSKNWFTPKPDRRFQFGDNLLWFKDTLFLYQAKSRYSQSPSSDALEQKWLDDHLKKAKKQIKDNINHLKEYAEIPLNNAQGIERKLKGTTINGVIKIIVYRQHSQYEIRNPFSTKHLLSKEVGFIHCLSIYDYIRICLFLVTPFEIGNYFIHRERALRLQPERVSNLPEDSLLGHYILLQQDLNTFDSDPLPRLEHMNILNELDTNREDLLAIHFFRKWSDGVLVDGREIDKEGYITTLEIISSLTRGHVRELTMTMREGIDKCLKDSFNNVNQEGSLLSGTLAFPFVGATFSVLVINENDSLVARQINDNASRFTMGSYGNDSSEFKYHVGIAFMRVPGDVRSFWTLLKYPADISSFTEDLLEGMRKKSTENTFGRSSPFKLKNSIITQ